MNSVVVVWGFGEKEMDNNSPHGVGTCAGVYLHYKGLISKVITFLLTIVGNILT